MNRTDLMALSDEREHWLARALDAWRDGYRAGRSDGWRAGRESAHAELAAAWRAVADPVSRGGPPFAELERRRWGPGGREHFASPRPGDYRGGPVSWAASRADAA